LRPDPDPDDPAPGMAIWGWMSPAELYWLHGVAQTAGSVAEIGCLHGRSAYALLDGCPGMVYCIDPWDDAADASYPSFLSACGHFANLVAVRGHSPAAAALVPDVDVTFIDGAHSFPAVLADIAAWLPKTRRLICGHDYQNADAGYPGVGEAVRAVFGADRVVVPPDTSIWSVDVSADRSVLPTAPSGGMPYEDEYGRAGTITIEWPT
jgi:hypothetical protein